MLPRAAATLRALFLSVGVLTTRTSPALAEAPAPIPSDAEVCDRVAQRGDTREIEWIEERRRKCLAVLAANNLKTAVAKRDFAYCDRHSDAGGGSYSFGVACQVVFATATGDYSHCDVDCLIVIARRGKNLSILDNLRGDWPAFHTPEPYDIFTDVSQCRTRWPFIQNQCIWSLTKKLTEIEQCAALPAFAQADCRAMVGERVDDRNRLRTKRLKIRLAMAGAFVFAAAFAGVGLWQRKPSRLFSIPYATLGGITAGTSLGYLSVPMLAASGSLGHEYMGQDFLVSLLGAFVGGLASPIAVHALDRTGRREDLRWIFVGEALLSAIGLPSFLQNFGAHWW